MKSNNQRGNRQDDLEHELKNAQREVETSRSLLDDAFNGLGGQLELRVLRFRDLLYRVKAPVRIARQYPYGNLSLFLVAGFAIGAWISSRRVRELSSAYYDGMVSTYPDRAPIDPMAI